MADATDAELISICTCGCERWDYDGTCHDCGKSRRELLLQSRIEALAARVAVLEGALRGIAEAKITFDYVTLVRNADGTIDSEAPASSYDRGKAEGYREAADIARAALTA